MSMFPMFPYFPRAQFKLGETNRQGTVAMAALGAPTACFFHTKIPLPIIAATPKSPSSPCKCVTVMGNLGTTVRNCQAPSAQLKLVRQSEVKKTQPYAFLNVENLRTRRTVHPRYKIFSNFPAILNHIWYIFLQFLGYTIPSLVIEIAKKWTQEWTCGLPIAVIRVTILWLNIII